MAKGILLVLGGSDADVPSVLNTILYGIGNVLDGVPAFLGAWFMYIFQSLFNLVVTSNSGQAALTMPIMAPLSDLVGVSRQIAVLAYQLGAGFVDAFTPVSARCARRGKDRMGQMGEVPDQDAGILLCPRHNIHRNRSCDQFPVNKQKYASAGVSNDAGRIAVMHRKGFRYKE